MTLDICGFHFQSELVRSARLQVNYVKKPSGFKISNEVVEYRPGGAAFALRELKRAVATCPRHPVKSAVAGVPPLTYRIRRFHASRLLPGAVSLRGQVSGTTHGRLVSFKVVAIYQVHREILSGVYVAAPAASYTSGALGFALHAARASAKNLKRT